MWAEVPVVLLIACGSDSHYVHKGFALLQLPCYIKSNYVKVTSLNRNMAFSGLKLMKAKVDTYTV